EQLLGRLARIELDQLLLLARQQQTRLELEQRGDQHQELRRRLQLELALSLQVIDVRDHDLREVDLQQVDLLPEDQRQQQVERAREHVEVELEVDHAHLFDQATARIGPDRRPSRRARQSGSRRRSGGLSPPLRRASA